MASAFRYLLIGDSDNDQLFVDRIVRISRQLISPDIVCSERCFFNLNERGSSFGETGLIAITACVVIHKESNRLAGLQSTLRSYT